ALPRAVDESADLAGDQVGLGVVVVLIELHAGGLHVLQPLEGVGHAGRRSALAAVVEDLAAESTVDAPGVIGAATVGPVDPAQLAGVGLPVVRRGGAPRARVGSL